MEKQGQEGVYEGGRKALRQILMHTCGATISVNKLQPPLYPAKSCMICASKTDRFINRNIIIFKVL